MYSHLTFPEYVITILNKSIEDFKPGYMERFKSYDGFNTAFPDFESFYSFYSSMLLQAKERAIGEVTLKIEPNRPTLNKGFTAYNFYDGIHIHPIFTVEIQEIGNAITLDVPPF